MDVMDLNALPFRELLGQVAERQPTPGGGMVAASVGAFGVALAQMSLRYSINKKTEDAIRYEIETEIDRLQADLVMMLQGGEADAAGYAQMNELQKLAADDPRRVEGWADAVMGAIQPPMNIAKQSVVMLTRLDAISHLCNRWLLSDLAIAAILGEAATRSAAWNVEVNLTSLDDMDIRTHLENEIAVYVSESQEICIRIENACKLEVAN